ncbi:hypothetical protein [Actinocrispum wychmicini]|uniref:hypothetical protein n=1 Tax=Actinocrispum wychmicini TaxID=1213861 RepID=UPI0010503AA5|nr:hypothetical protein [Actinocrispum wychmicini]
MSAPASRSLAAHRHGAAGQGTQQGPRWQSLYMGLLVQFGADDSRTRSRAAGVVVFVHLRQIVDMSPPTGRLPE